MLAVDAARVDAGSGPCVAGPLTEITDDPSDRWYVLSSTVSSADRVYVSSGDARHGNEARLDVVDWDARRIRTLATPQPPRRLWRLPPTLALDTQLLLVGESNPGTFDLLTTNTDGVWDGLALPIATRSLNGYGASASRGQWIVALNTSVQTQVNRFPQPLGPGTSRQVQDAWCGNAGLMTPLAVNDDALVLVCNVPVPNWHVRARVVRLPDLAIGPVVDLAPGAPSAVLAATAAGHGGIAIVWGRSSGVAQTTLSRFDSADLRALGSPTIVATSGTNGFVAGGALAPWRDRWLLARVRSTGAGNVQLGLAERGVDGDAASDEMAIALPEIASAFGPTLRMTGDRGMLLFTAQRIGRAPFHTFAMALRCMR